MQLLEPIELIIIHHCAPHILSLLSFFLTLILLFYHGNILTLDQEKFIEHKFSLHAKAVCAQSSSLPK